MVIRRELTKVYTAGTLVDEVLIGDSNALYLLAIKEDPASRTYGVCFVDTSTGEFYLAQFVDDKQRTQFETLIVEVKPREVLFEKNGLSPESLRMIKHTIVTPLITVRKPQDFWPAQQTMNNLDKEGYFTSKSKGKSFPALLSEMASNELALSALGGCICYLKEVNIWIICLTFCS
jgi:DNA mismatch repair protein MSH6